MVKQKDLQDVVEAVNEILSSLDKRISALEAEVKKQPVQRNVKKVVEKT